MISETTTDGTPVCVTGDQLAVLLAGASAANLSSTAAQPGPNATSTLPGSVTQNRAVSATPGTPPASHVNGDNPAIIHITYADPGATITGPTAHLNLGTRELVIPKTPLVVPY
jgi:hypothetical protein